MKLPVAIATAATAIAAIALSACSSGDSTTTGTGTSPNAGTTSVGVQQGASAKVTIDGKDQNVEGTVVCTAAAGNVNIAIGGQATGVAAVLTDANPPDVKSVGLGNVNGVTLGYTAGTGQGDARATKDGNHYTITGTATGIDMTNPTQPVKKPFEIDVSCS